MPLLKKSALVLSVSASIVVLIIGLLVGYPIIYAKYTQPTAVPSNTDRLTLPGTAASGVLRVGVIGDSTALGQGTDVQHSFSYQYLTSKITSLVQKIEYSNFAQSGAKAKTVLEEQIPKVINQNFQLIFVSLGANDVVQMTSEIDYRQQVKQIHAALTSQTQAKVAWLNIPDFISIPTFLFPLDIIASRRAGEFNALLQGTVTSSRVHIIDVYDGARDEFLRNPENMFAGDKFHPSESGYRVWAEIIAAELPLS